MINGGELLCFSSSSSSSSIWLPEGEWLWELMPVGRPLPTSAAAASSSKPPSEAVSSSASRAIAPAADETSSC